MKAFVERSSLTSSLRLNFEPNKTYVMDENASNATSRLGSDHHTPSHFLHNVYSSVCNEYALMFHAVRVFI